MIFKDNKFILKTGRTFHAHQGIIGIDDELAIYGGYDEDVLDSRGSFGSDWDDEGEVLDLISSDEAEEIADHMVQLWTDFKLKYGKPKKE